MHWYRGCGADLEVGSPARPGPAPARLRPGSGLASPSLPRYDWCRGAASAPGLAALPPVHGSIDWSVDLLVNTDIAGCTGIAAAEPTWRSALRPRLRSRPGGRLSGPGCGADLEVGSPARLRSRPGGRLSGPAAEPTWRSALRPGCGPALDWQVLRCRALTGAEALPRRRDWRLCRRCTAALTGVLTGVLTSWSTRT